MTDRDKSMYALGMIRMAKMVIAATRQINIVDSDSVMYAMGVRDTVKKYAPLSRQQLIKLKRRGLNDCKDSRFYKVQKGDEIKWKPAEKSFCYVTNPKLLGKDDIHD